MKQKLPNELSLDDLLNQITENNNKTVATEKVIEDNVLEFLSYYNITKGTEPVKRRVLYKMYKAWSKAQNYTAYYFGRRLAMFFQSDEQNVFINVDAIDLTKKAKEVFFTPETSSKYKNKNYKIQIEQFINEYNIQDGKYIIQGSALYYIYEDWAIKTKKKILSNKDFTAFFKLYFKYYQEFQMHSFYFYIDKLQLKVDGVTLEKAKTWAKNQNKAKAKKERTEEQILFKKRRKSKKETKV
jgi:hypothetical protein